MTELVTITPEDRKEILAPASAIVAQARAFNVVDAVTYTEAGESLKGIKAAQKNLEEKKKSLLQPVNETLKAIRKLFAAPEAELELAEQLYKRGMLGFSERLEAQRREEQRQADERARKERERLERQAADDRARAEAARAAGDTKRAEKLEQRADVRQDTAATVVAPVIPKDAPRVSGIAERENWYAIVVDFKTLVAAVAAGTVPMTALEPNMKFLNNQAKAMKRDLPYPGVQAAVDKIMAAGSR
jgi:septal ring factor EnvC (AmiA/AmiB activator)